MSTPRLDIELAVKRRYSTGARTRQRALCCPVAYRPDLLKLIAREIIERDYGCGDPSRHVQEGEVVLDLGSGAGKICYIAAQVVGPRGRVIGVDINDEMLAVARKYQKHMGDKLGYHNVTFRKGKIQDLKLDYDLLEPWLRKNPVTDGASYARLQARIDELCSQRPMISDDSIDVVVSNCVLNLVRTGDKAQLFREIYRVLKRGGRAVISDIVSDEDVPHVMQNNARLWSGCVSGAMREDLFLRAFEDVGFYGVQILERDDKPWRVVRGIEFRSVTVAAYKGKEGACWERNQAVIYKGPFKEVLDDDGHRLRRGERAAVCDKTYKIYSREPYRSHIVPIAPRKEIPLSKARPFDCSRTAVRDPHETKGMNYKATTGDGTNGQSCNCGPGCC